MELGEVSPVFKKDCCLTKSNYRPITILPSLSKIFETLIHSRISHYFDDIFHEHVFAYRRNNRTDTAFHSLTEQWRKALDQHNIIGIVFMDHSVSMDKTTELIHDYLTNRRQRVRLGDQLSNWKEISAVVPQGGVLGPLILNIFMNDLVYAVDAHR